MTTAELQKQIRFRENMISEIREDWRDNLLGNQELEDMFAAGAAKHVQVLEAEVDQLYAELEKEEVGRKVRAERN